MRYVENMRKKSRWLAQSAFPLRLIPSSLIHCRSLPAFNEPLSPGHSCGGRFVLCRANMIGAELSKHEVDVRFKSSFP